MTGSDLLCDGSCTRGLQAIFSAKKLSFPISWLVRSDGQRTSAGAATERGVCWPRAVYLLVFGSRLGNSLRSSKSCRKRPNHRRPHKLVKEEVPYSLPPWHVPLLLVLIVPLEKQVVCGHDILGRDPCSNEHGSWGCNPRVVRCQVYLHTDQST
jgi:hypothetical protein